MKKVIYDFGANNGDDIDYYLYKAELVIAVEANPLLCQIMILRFQDAINKGKLVIVNCVLVVNKSSDLVSFFIHKTNHVLSQFLRPENDIFHDYEEVIIPAQDPVSLVKKYGDPYYIKIDIEHYDQIILRELFNNEIRPPFISAESHTAEVFAILVALGGYRAFKLVDGASVKDKYKNLKVYENGESKIFSFPLHSAGPFGNDINGLWMNANNFLSELALEGLGWKDIHASNIEEANPYNIVKYKIHRPSIAFVTVCKGRLSHIKKMLPLIVEQCPDEIVFVDYSCPEKSGDYVRESYPTVKVVSITDDDGFCVARGRNIGAQAVISEFICFIDADIMIQPGFVSWAKENITSSFFYRAHPVNRNPETWGTFIVSKAAFNSSSGFDELYRGWGGEDDDIYFRLRLANICENYYPNIFVDSISHEDSLRVTFHKIKSTRIQRILCDLYLQSKMFFLNLRRNSHDDSPEDLDFELRTQIYSLIEKTIEDWMLDTTKTIEPITLTYNGLHTVTDNDKIKKQVILTISLE